MTESTFDTQAAQAAGVTTEEPVFQNYWGFNETEQYFLPDGKQYFIIQKMNEGQKSQFQKKTRSDVTVERATGNARLKADPASERHALLEACVTGWNLMRPDPRNPGGPMIPADFSARGKTGGGFEHWLETADPAIVEKLEEACRKLNPWLLSDVSIEDIDKQIEELQERREEILKRDAGE